MVTRFIDKNASFYILLRTKLLNTGFLAQKIKGFYSVWFPGCEAKTYFLEHF